MVIEDFFNNVPLQVIWDKNFKSLYSETHLHSPYGKKDLLFSKGLSKMWGKIKNGWLLPFYKLNGLKHNI